MLALLSHRCAWLRSRFAPLTRATAPVSLALVGSNEWSLRLTNE